MRRGGDCVRMAGLVFAQCLCGAPEGTRNAVKREDVCSGGPRNHWSVACHVCLSVAGLLLTGVRTEPHARDTTRTEIKQVGRVLSMFSKSRSCETGFIRAYFFLLLP